VDGVAHKDSQIFNLAKPYIGEAMDQQEIKEFIEKNGLNEDRADYVSLDLKHLKNTEDRRSRICSILGLTRAQLDSLLPILKKELNYTRPEKKEGGD